MKLQLAHFNSLISLVTYFNNDKRMVFGTYHFVSKDYVQRYLDETVYRYNTRKADEFAKSIGIVSYADVKVVKQVIAA